MCAIYTLMYITAVPNRHSPPAILLRESFRDGDKVRTRTLANLTSWAPERIEAMRRALKGEFDGLTGDLQPVCGPIFAVLFVLKQLAERVGLLRVLGTERWAKLVLFLILARVAAQGSRLSAVRWAAHHAVAETLGLGHFDEDDLYAALDRLAAEQERIEDALYRRTVRQRGGAPTVVLYDVTSSYVEGACNELAAFGYNRDKKAGKPQIVIGLVTTGTGEPLAVQVFDGNTSDPLTVPAQVETLKTRFGITEVVFVGDRGMVKRKGKTVLAAAGYKYITALTTPQVLKLLREGVLRPEWFTSQVYEVPHGPVRLVLRRSQAVHDRYRDLHEVEQDFRTMKTGLWEVRPIFVRKARRTRAHVFVTMLALTVVREMRRGLVAAFGTTDDDKMAVTVEDALLAFARLCLLTYHVQGTVVTRLPTPDARQKAILDALGTPLPPARSLRQM